MAFESVQCRAGWFAHSRGRSRAVAESAGDFSTLEVTAEERFRCHRSREWFMGCRTGCQTPWMFPDTVDVQSPRRSSDFTDVVGIWGLPRH